MAETWEQLQRQLGPCEVAEFEDEVVRRWTRPAALAGTALPFDLQFVGEGARSSPPDAGLLARWEGYAARHAEHAAWFARAIVAEYHHVFWEGRRPDPRFPVGLPDRDILALVETALVELRTTDDSADRTLAVIFEFAWDQSHEYACDFDEENGAFLPLEKR